MYRETNYTLGTTLEITENISSATGQPLRLKVTPFYNNGTFTNADTWIKKIGPNTYDHISNNDQFFGTGYSLGAFAAGVSKIEVYIEAQVEAVCTVPTGYTKTGGTNLQYVFQGENTSATVNGFANGTKTVTLSCSSVGGVARISNTSSISCHSGYSEESGACVQSTSGCTVPAGYTVSGGSTSIAAGATVDATYTPDNNRAVKIFCNEDGSYVIEATGSINSDNGKSFFLYCSSDGKNTIQKTGLLCDLDSTSIPASSLFQENKIVVSNDDNSSYGSPYCKIESTFRGADTGATNYSVPAAKNSLQSKGSDSIDYNQGDNHNPALEDNQSSLTPLILMRMVGRDWV